MNLLSAMDLTPHFNAGRFKQEPTVLLTGLGMAFNCPPEYIVVVDKVDIGACWQCDIESILDNIDPAVDTVKTNPNLLVFQNGLIRMQEMRDVMEARKAAFAKTAQIIPLFGRR